MRKQTWFRFGLASVILAGGTSAIAVGCGGDDNAVPAPDAGGHDGAFPDTGADVQNPTDAAPDTAVVKPHAKLIIIHASPNAPDVRLCSAVGAKADGSDLAVGPLPALPDDPAIQPAGYPYPALYAGSGGPLADFTDLEPKALTAFAIPMTQSTIAKLAHDIKGDPMERTCDALIGATGTGGVLQPGEFVKIGTIPAGTFVKGNTYLLAMSGCIPGDTSGLGDGKAKCGSDYNTTTGNLGVKVIQLDRTVADAAKLGLQVIHLAQPVDGFMPLAMNGYFDRGAKTVLGIARTDLDGGQVNPPAAVGVNFGYGVEGGTAVPQTYANADFANSVAYAKIYGLHTVPADPDAGTDASVAQIAVGSLPLPFSVVQQLSSFGSYDGGIYKAGGNYTLVFLGAPPGVAEQLIVQTDAGPAFNPNYRGYGLHIMMFPNDPPLPHL